MRARIGSTLKGLADEGQWRTGGILVLAALTVCIAFAWVGARGVDPLAYDHDVGWMLHAAGRLLNGGSIPEDVFDPNPPLIFWSMVPVVGLARLLSSSELFVMDIATMALALASAAAAYGLLLKVPDWGREHAVAGAAAAFFLHFTVGWQGGFGQRDHLIVMLLVPYVLLTAHLSAGGAAGLRVRAAVATGAAVGIALRPYYVLLWLACEAYRMIFSRRGTPLFRRHLESLVVVAVGIVYVAAVLIACPEWLEKLRMTAATYGAYETPFVWQTATFWKVVANAALAVVFRFPAPVAHLVRVTAIAAAASYLVAAIQSKNWFYHQIPATVISELGIALAALGLSRIPNLVRFGRLAPLLLTLGVVVRSAVLVEPVVRHAGPPVTTLRHGLLEAYARYASGKSVFVMSTSVPPTYPAVNHAAATSASRFSCLWLAPGLYQGVVAAEGRFPYRPPSEWGPAERYFVEAVLEDLRQHDVHVLVNDVSRHKQAFGVTTFDFMEYFGQLPQFRHFFANFRFLGKVGGAYEVWVRKDPAP